MDEYFHRQFQLWSDFNKDGVNTQEKLASKSIAIIGAGGLGSALAYALCTSGIGKVYVVDYDKVCLHNIHRQIVFELADEGCDKASVYKRLEARYQGVKILPYIGDAKSFFREQFSYDLILDASDNIEARSQIAKAARQRSLPWVYCSVEGFHTQVCLFKNSDFDSFFKKPKTPAGIAAPIVMLGAALAANLALMYLAGLSVQVDRLYYLDISSGELKFKNFELAK